MQKDQVCMFCYYRNKRLAACAHAQAIADANADAPRRDEGADPRAGATGTPPHALPVAPSKRAALPARPFR